jgi:predicted PurR-regulated permease PerM
MERKYVKAIGFAAALAILILIVWYAINVFLLAFAAILLAILLNAVGQGAKKILRLPYPLSLLIALIFILGILILIFWLYSPVIADQSQLLIKQLPEAAANLRSDLTPFFGPEFLSEEKLKKEFSLSNQKLYSQLLTVFSTTVGSVAGFIIFLIVGLYLAFDPSRYMRWILLLIPPDKQKRIQEILEKIGHSLRWWLLGKLLSMVEVGILTFVGLTLLGVSLALVLGFLAALLTFIPYVGALLAAIPAILIAFTQSPLQALYVIILYVGIHLIDGYLITPFIEQRTVSIPPALTIMAQVLLVVLIGGIGLALATPIVVVAVAFVHLLHKDSSPEISEKPQKPDNN